MENQPTKESETMTAYSPDGDDFCQDNNRLDVLYKIKENNPDFKITLYTILGRCSDQFIEDMKKIDWITMIPHGWMHETSRECENWTYEESIEYLEKIERYGLEKGFKCYDEQTEILTVNGWKSFSELNKREEVISVDKNGNAKVSNILDYFSDKYSGEMIMFGNKNGIGISVTPDHRMLVSNRQNNKIEVIKSKDTNSNHNIVRKINWKGKDQKYIHIGDKKILLEDYLKFVGLFVSEGSAHKNRITIYQKDVRSIEERLKNFPFNKKVGKNFIRINSKILYEHCIKEFGRLSYIKKIPSSLKNLNPEKLNILLDNLIFGDGSIRKENGAYRYFTTSKILADDVQEIMLKTGRVANIRERKTKGNIVDLDNGRIYYQNHNQFIVDEVVGRVKSSIRTGGKYKNKKSYNYNGNIYCVTVPDGFIVVRNKNKKRPIICGNSPGWQISDGLYQALLEKGYWVADQHYNDHRRPKELKVIYPTEHHYHLGHLGGHNENEIGYFIEQLSNLKICNYQN